MALRRYRKATLPPGTTDAVSRNFDAVEQLSRDLEATRFVDGELLEDVDYSGSAVTVKHSLNRQWVGYIVTKRDATETVAALDADNTAADKLTEITLSASGNVVFDLWIF